MKTHDTHETKKPAPDSTPADTHNQLQHLQIEIDKALSKAEETTSQLRIAAETARRLTQNADPHKM